MILYAILNWVFLKISMSLKIIIKFSKTLNGNGQVNMCFFSPKGKPLDTHGWLTILPIDTRLLMGFAMLCRTGSWPDNREECYGILGA